MGKVIADLASSAASATFNVENAASSVNYVLSKTDGSANDHLKTDGAGNLAWVAAPSGGLSHYSQWRLNANFTGDKIPIDGTLLEAVIAADPQTSTDSPTSSTAVGSPMTYDDSTGVFTFPATGYWNILFHVNWLGNSNIDYLKGSIAGTTDDSSYNIFAVTRTASQKATVDDIYIQATTEVLFDITDTSTHKVRFEIDVETGTPTCLGVASGSGHNRTFMTFAKIADT